MNRLLVLAIAAVALTGCGNGGFSKRSSTASAGTFRYTLSAAPTTLDPAKVQDIDTTDLLANVFEGLVSYDDKNHIVGQIAESWKGTQGGKVWTFTLRPNVKFHNGRAVTADDVKWSFERACGDTLSSITAANYLRDIVGATEVTKGQAKQISGIKVIDPKTIEFTLDKPRAYFLGKLTYPCAFVVAKEACGLNQINDVKAAVGTGPFRLTKFDVGQQAELEANKDYYLGAPKLQRIIRPIVLDASTRMNMYKNGEIDMLTVQRQDLVAVERDPKLKAELVYEPRPAVFYVGLNQLTYPPFRDARVRRAFAMAIDRTRICHDLLQGMPEAHGMIAPGIIGYREGYAGLPYDPAGARKLLADAGYPNGKGLPPLQFVFRASTPDSQHVSEGVESSLRQNLNFPLKMQSLEWGSFLDARNKGKLQSYFLSWYADYLDPQNFLSFLLTSGSPQNRDGYRNPEFDRLCELGDTTVDEPTRLKYYQQAEDVLIQDGGRVPIYFGRDAILVSPKVHGIRNNLFGQLPHTTVTVD
ncbi:peptide ABC transporter substrate-binding protein [Fimbriimonas ginsengisoli]|uniref:Extracellular solute-binding protein n=1 Tax=Fimbriimonas ginsengisoli Gsoil 348 TaxID=661478 RepID=A0A068NP75_FIMGI|nr:peptide ABC transporter substrate-binding protein [Fimbriimonas ginsengisoli]AIE85246.1 extracellular solute-binding protein [Fimbriimonas ginsengisoli Gsoil 348]